MKTPFFRFALCAIACLIHTYFNRVEASSPPPAENYKPENRHYTRTFAANLDVGEPRTVRMIYFLPKDRPYRAEVVQRMKDEIRAVQTFFAEQMEAHGYGRRTFRVETDSQGEPMVHRVDGQHPYSHYQNLPFGMLVFTSAIRGEIREMFDFNSNIYVIVIDNGRHDIYGLGGFGSPDTNANGDVFLPSEFSWQNMAHELGHAFRLHHDFRDDAFIMSYGKSANQLSSYSAMYLAVNPHFNHDIIITDSHGAGIDIISPKRYSTVDTSVPIQLEIRGRELHQVILLVESRYPHPAAGWFEVKEHRKLAGEREIIIDFDYDGVIPSDSTTSLSDYMSHPIAVLVVNTDGSESQRDFLIVETPPQLINTLQSTGVTNGRFAVNIESVAFSPNGTIIASAVNDGTVRLWDVATHQNIITLSDIQTRHQDWDYIKSVAFSPDGTIIASGLYDGTVKLWNIATQQKITTLRAYKSVVTSVSFSPDGKILASGLFDGTVKLWDMVTLQNITTLEGNTGLNSYQRPSVSFSPDGSLIASGSSREIRLWDIATKQNIAIFTPTDGSVSFSPDGSILASGSHEGIRLWDIATKQNIVILGDWLGNASFSPDGTTIAAAVGNNIYLWDVVTEAEIATFVHTDYVQSLSFSPDGRILAAGDKDGKIEMWDTSGLIQPHLEATESPSIIADVNADGVINILDLVTIANHISNGTFDAMADVNEDGVMNVLDLILVAGMFDGAAAAPAAQLQVPATLTAVEVQDWLTDARSLEIRDPIMKRGFLVLEQLLISLTPKETKLLANYPNPFNPETWIPFRLAEDADVRLTIYDVGGRAVRTPDIGHNKAGIYESRNKAIYWDGKNDLGENVASGVYFYHLMAGEYSATRRMVILK